MKKRTLLCLSVAAGAMLLLSGCGVYYSVRGFFYWMWDATFGQRELRCCENLSQLHLAIVQYQCDAKQHDKKFTMPSKDDLVKGEYLTDPECYRCPKGDVYEFVIPAGTNTNSPEFLRQRLPSGIEMIRCPVHGWTLYLGGNVSK